MSYLSGVSRQQRMLLPDSVEDYVGADNPVRVVDAFVEGLDLPALGFELKPQGTPGAPAYEPKALLKLYVYGYLNRIRSSRELEKATRRNLEVIWLLGQLMPDHWTINAFRREHRARFKTVFRQFNLICGNLGLFGKELVAIDGTFLKAVNNPQRNFTRAKVEKMLEEIDRRTNEYLEALETADREAAAQSMAGPCEEPKAASLRSKLATMEKKRSECHALLEAMEKTPTGQVSLTDPDSRLLEKQTDRTVGYNAQIAVDAAHHLIVTEEVTQEPTDVRLLAPMATAAKEALGVEQIKVVADAGYYSHRQVRMCEEQAIEAYVPSIPQAPAGEGAYPKECFHYDAERDLYRCPQGRVLTRHADTIKQSGRYHVYYSAAACRDCPVRKQCTRGAYRKITVHEDQPLIDQVQSRLRQHPKMQRERGSIVEHAFGTLKFWQGYRSFLARGLEMVRAEFSLSCLAYNLRRALNVVGVSALLAALQKPILAAA
jgi:transposase